MIDPTHELPIVRQAQLLDLARSTVYLDGKGCWCGNVFVERLWKSVKYEPTYLHACETTSEARTKRVVYLDFHNCRRPHSSLDRQAPDDVCFNQPQLRLAA